MDPNYYSQIFDRIEMLKLLWVGMRLSVVAHTVVIFFAVDWMSLLIVSPPWTVVIGKSGPSFSRLGKSVLI